MRLILTKSEKARIKKIIVFSIILALVISLSTLFFKRNITLSISVFFAVIFIVNIYFYFRKLLQKTSRIKKMELVFPDFLQLISSNLRAGMTIDRAFLLSSRPEFNPLDLEIFKTGKEIATGKEIDKAFLDMSKRIGSEKIHKIILLILSGIRAGGNIAILLEETAVNMRQRGFIEKKAASSVLMYVIFIFLVVSIFAPILFALSTVLVDVLIDILSNLPSFEATPSTPFTLSNINISSEFIIYFSIVFILVVDILSSLVLGLVSKGEEKQGLRFLPPMIILSLTTFLLTRLIMARFLSGFI